MNKFMFSGKVLEAVYTPAQGTKKSRAIVKAVVFRKGKETEIEYVAFTPCSEFIARGMGLIPMENGNSIPEERKCFMPGSRIEGTAYIQNNPYTDRNGVVRPGYQLILEEASSEPVGSDGAAWLNSYIARKNEAQQNAAGYQANGQHGRTYAPAMLQSGNVGNAQQAAGQVQTPQYAQQRQAPVQQGGFTAGNAPQNRMPIQQGGFVPGNMPNNMAAAPQGGFRPGGYVSGKPVQTNQQTVAQPQAMQTLQANKPGGYAKMPIPSTQSKQ